jgi:D-threo-aldose 1-dehydrogenase
MYQAVDDREIVATVRAILDMGVNYVDTAPLYGHGNSEERFGKALEGRGRSSFVVSTKVGRLLRPATKERVKTQFVGVPPVDWDFNFSRDAVLRSFEGSLKRLKLDKVDILFIHDPHNHYEQAIREAYPAIAGLREQKMVRAIGVGMDGVQHLIRFAGDGDFDCFLLWGRYSLLDQTALPELLPLCQKKGISIVLGAPYESGILASDVQPGAKFRYSDASQDVIERARRIKEVCDRHNVPLKAAAIQFPFGHPAVKTTIPGTRSVERMAENMEMLRYPIPAALWQELKDSGIIPGEAPTPKG